MTAPNAGGGDWLDLPTAPIPHRGRSIPQGLNWDQITADYVAADGQVDAGVWGRTEKVRIIESGRRGSDRVHTFAERDDYQESAAPVPRVKRATKRAASATPRRTLSDALRAEIAARYVAGEHMPELAAAYNVGVGSVSWALKACGVKPRSQAEARALAKAKAAS